MLKNQRFVSVKIFVKKNIEILFFWDKVRGIIMTNVEEKLLTGLNPQQKEAVLSIEGPVRVVAGAGSGKTSVLTKRVALMLERGISPYNILAITFTNKAANEMKERIAGLVGKKQAEQITISTFHSFCARFIRRNVDAIPDLKDRNFTIKDEDDKKTIVTDCLKELNIDAKAVWFTSAISDFKNNLLLPDMIKTDWRNKDKIAVYRMYQDRLRANNSCDFDDLLVIFWKMLKNHPELLERFQEQFKYISVDEYQDTNGAQYEIVRLLAKKYQNIFIVGDVDQSIYSFRGADFSNMMNFDRDYPNAKLIKLERNYRSTEIIVNAANAVIENNKERIEKVLWTDDKRDIPIICKTLDSGDEEAIWVTQQIKKEIREKNRKPNDICVLIRNNALSRPFEECFVKASIPYIVIGARTFYDRKEVKDTLAYLNVLANPSDLISLRRIINEPKRGIGDKSVQKFINYCIEHEYNFFEGVESLKGTPEFATMMPKKGQDGLVALYEAMAAVRDDEQTPLYKNVEKLMIGVGYIKALRDDVHKEGEENSQTRIDNIYSLIDLARTFRNSPDDQTVENFLEHVALISGADTSSDDKENVTIMTCHAAKGLEYPVVFLVAFEEDVLPSFFATRDEKRGKPKGIEEERRLCYVAITRAKEQLYLTSARFRMIQGNCLNPAASRFYREIPPELLQGELELGMFC